MKVLVLYDYPPAPGGLATQGDLLYHGLLEMGVEARAAHLKSDLEKEWHYRWFKPDAVVGVGFWGDYPEIVQHPRAFGMTAVPWLLADGYVANYRQELNGLPLILVTANWVKQTFERDGIRSDAMVVLPVGCDTGAFVPRSMDDPKVSAVRDMLGGPRTSCCCSPWAATPPPRAGARSWRRWPWSAPRCPTSAMSARSGRSRGPRSRTAWTWNWPGGWVWRTG